jgi:hypothetical protein
MPIEVDAPALVVVDDDVVRHPEDPGRSCGRLDRSRPAYDTPKDLADEVVGVSDAEAHTATYPLSPRLVQGCGLAGRRPHSGNTAARRLVGRWGRFGR